MLEIRQIYIYPLERAEAAMAGLYPLLMLSYGAVFGFVFNIISLLLLCGMLALMFAGTIEGDYQTGFEIGQGLAGASMGLLAFFLYGNAVLKLRRWACIFWSVCFAILGVWQIYNGAVRVAAKADAVSAYLSIGAGVLLIGVTAAIGLGWLNLALATDQDRVLLRPPFRGMLNRFAIQFFSGLPPIITFVRSFSARLLILASTVFFAVAFVGPLAAAREVVNLGDAALQVTIIVSAIVLAPVAVAIANLLLRWGQNRIRFSIEQITAVDARPPILFLRAFRDDQVALANPHYTLLGRFFAIATPRLSLDHILLNEGTLYGPVVALGNPSDPLPPYGVARGYVSDARWKDTVAALAKDALAVILCVDDTDSMWWEIDHIVTSEHLQKTVFLIHPNFRGKRENAAIMARLLARLPIQCDQTPSAQEAASTSDVIGFFVDKAGNLCIGKSDSFTRFSYLLMTRWFLRKEFGLQIRLRAPVSRRGRASSPTGLAAAGRG